MRLFLGIGLLSTLALELARSTCLHTPTCTKGLQNRIDKLTDSLILLETACDVTFSATSIFRLIGP
jgi:hypothetical protein